MGFDVWKPATQGCNHCRFSVDDRTYSGVLGVNICSDYLGSVPALAENAKPNGLGLSCRNSSGRFATLAEIRRAYVNIRN